MATDMADEKDMADEDKAVTPDGTAPGMRPAAGESSAPEHGTPWTASDARGPLETASETHARAASDAMANEAAAPEAATTATAPRETAAPNLSGAAAEAPKSRSLLPVAAGLVIGALIGAGSAAIVYTAAGSSSGADPQVASLAARVDALEHRPEPQAADASLKATVDDLGRRVAALQAKPPAAAQTQPPAGARPQPAAPPVDLGPLQRDLAALRGRVDALAAQGAQTDALAAKIAALDGDIATTKKDLATTKKDVATTKKDASTDHVALTAVQGDQKMLATKVMVPALSVVADSLVQQIDQGQPYAAQVDALVALGADPAKIAVLRQNADQGVPSAAALAARFEPLAEPIAATAHKAPANAGFVDRLKSGMFSMVSVHSVDDTSGTDLPSRVARIRTQLAHDDVAGALATWDLLPPEAKTKGEAWAALAKTSAEAMSAARALQHDAIVALGAKKS